MGARNGIFVLVALLAVQVGVGIGRGTNVKAALAGRLLTRHELTSSFGSAVCECQLNADIPYNCDDQYNGAVICSNNACSSAYVSTGADYTLADDLGESDDGVAQTGTVICAHYHIFTNNMTPVANTKCTSDDSGCVHVDDPHSFCATCSDGGATGSDQTYATSVCIPG